MNYSELPIRLDVWFEDGEPFGRMLVMDESDMFREIMLALKKKSFGLLVRIMFCGKHQIFTGEFYNILVILCK